MTTLMSTSPTLLESTAWAASTVYLASTALSPKQVWALGFIWVIELAACMPNERRTRKPRTNSKNCKVGYAYHPKFGQCLRKKYKGNWKEEQYMHTSEKPTNQQSTTWGPMTVEGTGGQQDEFYSGESNTGGSKGDGLLGYGDNLGK